METARSDCGRRRAQRAGWPILNRIDDLLRVECGSGHLPVPLALRRLRLDRLPGPSGDKGGGVCHRGGVDGSPLAAMAITRADPEVSGTGI